MRDMLQFYIDGDWVDPVTPNPFPVINPATEEVCGHISLGSAADVDKAVAAASALGTLKTKEALGTLLAGLQLGTPPALTLALLEAVETHKEPVTRREHNGLAAIWAGMSIDLRMRLSDDTAGSDA